MRTDSPSGLHLRDGYELHRAALRYGLDIALYPRQVLIARPAGEGPELSFVHGLPEASNLAAVTYAQDKRMRRELLARAGLPTPPGATFAIGRELTEARELARRIGYPVVVKPAVGDNLGEVLAGLRNETELGTAIDYLRTPELERPTFTRTAYALTLLLEPDEEDGRSVAPAGYQFLLEKHVTGDYLQLVLIDDEVRAAVHLPGGRSPGPVRPAPPREVGQELHPSLAALAVRALRSIPGLRVGWVGMVVTDHRRAADVQELSIVDLSERPGLDQVAAADEPLAHQLGEAILADSAARAALTLADPRDEVSVEVLVEGAADPAGVVAAITKSAGEHGLSGEVSVADPVEGTAAGALRGAPGQLAWIFEALLDGQLYGQRAMLVDLRHQS